MEMTKKQLDQYVDVTEGKYTGTMYKINKAEFTDVNGKNVLKLDYDVINLSEGHEEEFEQWLGEHIIRALQYAVDNDPLDGTGI